MITTAFSERIKVGQIIQNQLPEFLVEENPKIIDFLKQYYLSQDFPGGPSDIAENLDLYLKLDNLTPEAMSGHTTLISPVGINDTEIFVNSTKGFPPKNGLLKIDDEIITYQNHTATSFVGCIRGFSGITSSRSSLDQEELVFSTSVSTEHSTSSKIENLSILFLKEFYKKLKSSLTPGLEDVEFSEGLDVSNFIKSARSFYQSKGTEESFRILFKILFNESVKLINLDDFLLRPSSAQYLRRAVAVAEKISGNPFNLIGQIIYKINDLEIRASISNVQFISTEFDQFYKLDLYLGFFDSDNLLGNFTITPKTKAIGNVSIGSSVITVDSTLGFSESGQIISGENLISYKEKTINQFLGCEGINFNISTTDAVILNDLYFGYENGDISNICKLRLTGVISEFETNSEDQKFIENEKISVRNLGLSIKNPTENKTFKEVFANSWIYNTSVTYEIFSINGSTFKLSSKIDKSSLREGDLVDILLRGSTDEIIHSEGLVKNINYSNNQIILDNISGFSYNPSLYYSIRRILKKCNSSGAPILYGNDNITANIQNIYLDDSAGYFYVASNSLPSYTITKELTEISLSNAEGGTSLQGLDSETLLYHIIAFQSSVPFKTGDEIFYIPETTKIPELYLDTSYFVKVDSVLSNKIQLYNSKSFINSENYIEFSALPIGVGGKHTFILKKQSFRNIVPQKNLIKFLANQNIKNGLNEKTKAGKIGTLINGVDIINYKSDDNVYYGPIDNIKILNTGENYDVINPPTIKIYEPTFGGTTALLSPVISGNVKEVYIDPQDFGIEDVISITLSGGNGNGCILQPILDNVYREVEFDSRTFDNSGGVDVINESITFLSNHNFKNGQKIVYNSNGNDPLGLGTYFGSNTLQNLNLINASSYYASLVNGNTIKLYSKFNDYISGINTIGFTTEFVSGIHKFRTFDSQKIIKEIKVINSGSGYQNRKLYIKPKNVILSQDLIKFNNHNFNDGDFIEYQCIGIGNSSILGLSTSNKYYILKLDSNSFILSDAGIGG